MAAPTFVGAGAGVTIASGSAACTAAGSGVAVGDLVVLHVLQDGATNNAVSISAVSGLSSLGGAASALTAIFAPQNVTVGSLGKQLLWMGRATSTTCSVTVATTGDDLYYRLYVFRGAAAGTGGRSDLNFNAITSSSGFALGSTSSNLRRAQQFTAPFTGTLDTISTGLYQLNGSPTDGVIVEIQTESGGVPSGTVVGSSITVHPHLTPFAFDLVPVQAPITSGVKYWIVWRRVGTFNASNYYSVYGATPTYASHNSSTYGLSSWGTPTGATTYAFVFACGAFEVIENGTVLWVCRPGNLNTVVDDVGVTTLGADRLALNFVAVDDDNPLAAFTGMTGGTWAEAVAEFASATGTDGAIQLQTATIASAGTIDGGTQTMAAADNWGVVGFALKPVAAAGTNWEQPVDDTLSLADSATTQTGKSATIGDTLTLADAASSVAEFARTVADPLSLTDSQAFQRDVVLPLADTLVLADLAAAQREIAQAVADTLALADLATTAAGKGVTLADTLALADSLSSAGVFQRAIADTLSLADTLAAQSAFQLSIADTLALADSLASQAAFARALADTLTLADLADPVKGVGGVDHTQPIADTLTLADALTAGSTLARAIADTLAVADSLTAQKAILRDLADTVTLADTIRFGRALGLTDTAALVDAVSFQAVYLRTLADTVSLADAVTASRVLTQAVADLLAFADSLTFTAGRGLLLEDTIALADLLETLFTAAIGEQPPAGTITFPSLGGLTRASRGPRITQPTHGARTRADRGKTDTPRGGVLTKTARGDVT